MKPWLRVTSAVVQTGSSDARSDCGTKVSVVASAARTIAGAASTAAAPPNAAFRTVLRFIPSTPATERDVSAVPVHPAIGRSRNEFAWRGAYAVAKELAGHRRWPQLTAIACGESLQCDPHAADHGVPVPGSGLAKLAQRRIPRAIVPILEPAPAGVETVQ